MRDNNNLNKKVVTKAKKSDKVNVINMSKTLSQEIKK